MTTYAKTTDVSPEQSRGEIEAALKRYGATAFIFGWDSERGINLIEFTVRGRSFRLNVPMPDPQDAGEMERLREIAVKARARRQHIALVEQGRRQRWRAMLLYVKAILEAVENGVVTMEAALLPSLVLPNGRTVGEWAGPQIEQAVLAGHMPPLLTSGPEAPGRRAAAAGDASAGIPPGGTSVSPDAQRPSKDFLGEGAGG